MKVMLLFVLALTALPVLASSWDCVPLKESKVLTYKAKCNQFREVEFTKIRLHVEGTTSYLSALSMRELCEFMGLNTVGGKDKRHTSWWTGDDIRKKVRSIEHENGRFTVGELSSSFYTAEKVVCGEPRTTSDIEL